MLKGIIFDMEPGYTQRISYVTDRIRQFQEEGYQVAEKVSSLKETAEKMNLVSEECLVFTDSERGCDEAERAGMTCIAYIEPGAEIQGMYTAAMLLEGFEEMDGAFLNKVYCHAHHLPAQICETERLWIREMEEKDIPRLVEICSERSSKAACEGAEKTLKEEIEGFEHYRTYMYELCDMGYWCVVLKETGEIIGKAGIEPKYWNQETTVVELGYVIDEGHRNQGYAYEACKAILKEAEERGAVELHCRIRKENEPSKRLAQKLGFVKLDADLFSDEEAMEIWKYTCH